MSWIVFVEGKKEKVPRTTEFLASDER